MTDQQMEQNEPLQLKLPERSGTYKFMHYQSCTDDRQYVRFGQHPTVCREINHDFAKEMGLKVNEEAFHRRLFPDGIAPLIDSRFREPLDRFAVIGAGQSVIDLEARTALFGGKSVDYGYGPNEEKLRELFGKEAPGWELSFTERHLTDY